MELSKQLILGTIVTTLNTITIAVPSILPKEAMDRYYFCELETLKDESKEEKEEENDEVTHEKFFGENISRALKLFKKS